MTLTGIAFGENQTISYTGGNTLFVLSETESIKINSSQETSLTLRINATTSFDSSLLENYSSTVEKLVNYTADNRYGDRALDANNCYGSDVLCGGDDWVRPSFKIIFENFTGVVYNDFSNMNGGYFPPHTSHQLGEDVDVKFTGNAFTVNAESARKLIDYLNDTTYGKYIDKTFVTFNAEFEQEIKDVILHDGCKVEDYIKNEIDHTDHFHWRLSSDQRICPSSDTPVIISLMANDPDDLDDVYSRSDTITITFDSDTNTPGGTSVQRKPVVDDMFTFTESLGSAYSGKWTAQDTFTITINSVNNAGPPIISGTTVTPAGTTPILSIDETPEPSTAVSPVLSGDFGIP